MVDGFQFLEKDARSSLSALIQACLWLEIATRQLIRPATIEPIPSTAIIDRTVPMCGTFKLMCSARAPRDGSRSLPAHPGRKRRNKARKIAHPRPHAAFKMKPMMNSPTMPCGRPPNFSGQTTNMNTRVRATPPATMAAIQ